MKNSMVKIPKPLYIISQSDVIFFFLSIFFALLPTTVVVYLFFYRNIISSIIGRETLKIILLICSVWMILTILFFAPFPSPYAERFIRRIQNRPLRRWILKNINCPYCGGDLKAKRSSKSDEFFFHYEYFCEKCGRKFELKQTEKELEWKIVLHSHNPKNH